MLHNQGAGRISSIFSSQLSLTQSQHSIVGSVISRKYEYDKAFNITTVNGGPLAWAAEHDLWGKYNLAFQLAANDSRPRCQLRFAGQYEDEDKFVGNKFE